MLEHLKDTVLLVDESFIDFCGDRNGYSAQGLIDKYQRLVVIRSLSKEFGIPGIRLGYLLTKHRAIREVIEEHLPIWNINSVAEFFLERFPDYQQDYQASIERIINNRKEFLAGLSRISYLKVFNSYANFFFCKLVGRSAETLKKKLFDDFKILIKSCANKKPLEKENYIRLTVRTKEENDKLISALESL